MHTLFIHNGQNLGYITDVKGPPINFQPVGRRHVIDADGDATSMVMEILMHEGKQYKSAYIFRNVI